MSSTRSRGVGIAEDEELPALEPGDHLDQKTFHARYEAMPDGVRAELVGGVVYMPSPLRRAHARCHAKTMCWLGAYEAATPEVESYDNPTVILGPESEPQPDACLAVLPAKGGRTRSSEDDYLEGPPELVVEIASSTESYDLHRKTDDYELAGVGEYLAVALRQRKVFWFISRAGRFELLSPDAGGIFRSDVFPGLWLDPAALLSLDGWRLMEVLEEGLASKEHATFVRKLANG